MVQRWQTIQPLTYSLLGTINHVHKNAKQFNIDTNIFNYLIENKYKFEISKYSLQWTLE